MGRYFFSSFFTPIPMIFTHMITSNKFQLKQTWRLIKAVAEMKLDTEQTIKLE